MTPAHLRALAMAIVEDYGCRVDAKNAYTLAKGLLAALDVVDAARRQAEAMDALRAAHKAETAAAYGSFREEDAAAQATSEANTAYRIACDSTETAIRAYDALAMDNEMEKREA